MQVESVPLHPPPCQPERTIKGSGVAASLIVVPAGSDAEQPLFFPVRQVIPAGVLTTDPVPFPAKATVNWKLPEAEGVGVEGVGLEGAGAWALDAPPQELSMETDESARKVRSMEPRRMQRISERQRFSLPSSRSRLLRMQLPGTPDCRELSDFPRFYGLLST